MIGNDVVDIQLAKKQSNWQRKGYLEKIFTLSERHVIESNSQPELMVWTLWSMKEAAYKIYNRNTGHRGYFPHLFNCSLNLVATGYSGVVYHDDKVYYTHTYIYNDLIHTIAVEDKEHLNGIYYIEEGLIIKDKSGLPYLKNGQKLLPVSVSHHGRYHKVVGIKNLL